MLALILKEGVMRGYYDMATDDRLLEMVRSAEKRRRWNRMVNAVSNFRRRVNWWPLLGALICMSSAAAVFAFFIQAYIWASRWYR